MAVAAYGVGRAYLLHGLYGLYPVVVTRTVDGHEFALLKAQLQHLASLLGGVLEVCALGQALRAVEYLSAADAGAPDAHVVGILQLGEVGKVAVGVQIVHLLLAGEVAVAGEGDDFHTGGHNEERHVEAYLVVASPGGAVCYGAGAYLLGIAGYGYGLEYAFAGHADGITVVAQDVAEDHVLERLLVVLLCDVQCDIGLGAQPVGILLVGLQLLGAETARVGTCGIHLIAFLLGQVHDRVTRIEAATEGNHYFLLLHDT